MESPKPPKTMGNQNPKLCFTDAHSSQCNLWSAMYTWQVATYPRTLATGLCDYGVLRNACIETSGFADVLYREHPLRPAGLV